MKSGKIHICLLLILTALLLPVPVQAAGPIDPSHPVTLEISFLWEEQPLSGAEFSIWQICDVDAYGSLTPLAAYEALAPLLDIQGKNDQRWQEAAAELERYLLSHPELAATDSARTDGRGIAAFPSGEAQLPQGLYLVRSVHHTQDHHVYSTAPFFVMLPTRDRNRWDYSVQTWAKPEQREEQICLRVMKEWEDKYWENQRPDKIRVNLYQDDWLYDSVILPQNGKWTYQWGGLDAAHSWWVEESAVPGYTTQVVRKGNTFYITNTYVQPGTQDPTLPQTGQLWWPVPVLLAFGLLLMILGLLKKGRKLDER